MALTRNDISYLSTAVVTAQAGLSPRMYAACQAAIVKLNKELEHRETKLNLRRAEREDIEADIRHSVPPRFAREFIAEV